MNRRTWLFVAVLIVVGVAFAQVTLLPLEQFSGASFPPTGWITRRTVGAASDTFARNTSYYYSSPASAARVYTTLPMVSWLVTPRIDASLVSNVFLRFWQRIGYPTYYDTSAIYVSTHNQNPASGTFVFVGFVDITGCLNTWGQKTVDLSAFAGEDTIYIAFVYQGTNAHDWYIDDVEVFGYNPGFIEGYVNMMGLLDDSGAQVKAFHGSDTFSTITNSDGYYFLPVYAETWTVQASYPAPGWTTAQATGILISPNDTVRQDFTLYYNPPISTAASFDFEANDGGFVPNPTTNAWEWGTPTSVGPSSAHSGTKCWGTNIDGNYSNSADWKLEKQFNLSTYSSPITLYWWQWYEFEGTSTAWDGGNVKVSTNGGSSWFIVSPSGGYNAIAYSGNAGIPSESCYAFQSTSWIEKSIDLSPYAGLSDVRVRWHFGSDNSVYYSGWYIDDVRLMTSYTGASVIKGRVILTGASDYAGVSINAFDGVNTLMTETDVFGYYVLPAPPGTYAVWAYNGPYWTSDTVEGVVVHSTADTVEVNFTLNPRAVGTVIGYVDITTTPGPDAGIPVRLCGVTTEMNAVTNAAGRYVFDGVPVGTYVVVADKPPYYPRSSDLFYVEAYETTMVDTIYLTETFYEYFTDLEADDGGWDNAGLDDWEWGVPSVVGPATAYSGTRCWGTNIDGNYVTDGDYELYIDPATAGVSSIDNLTFYHWYKTEYGFDGCEVWVTTDGGLNWELAEPEGGYPAIDYYGDPAYTGSQTYWDRAYFDLTPYPGIDYVILLLYSDFSINDAGWYVDDIGINYNYNPLLADKGCLYGYVYDPTTYAGIQGARVICDGETTYSGPYGYFIFCDIPVGRWPLYASKPGYIGANWGIVANGDTFGPVWIPLYPFPVSPSPSFDGSVFYGGDSAEVTLCNPTSVPLDVNLAGLGGGGSSGGLLRTTSRPVEQRGTGRQLYMISNPADISAYISKKTRGTDTGYRRGTASAGFARTMAISDFIDTLDLSSFVGIPWGMGTTGVDNLYDYWVSDVNLSGLTADRQFDAYGNLTGTYFECLWASPSWAADMTYDGSLIWQVRVGSGSSPSTNNIYGWNPSTGVVEAVLADPWGVWNHTSQRGVAYDPVVDVFYIGGWNDNLIYKVKGFSWDNPGQIMTIYAGINNVAGIGFHRGRRTVWVATNTDVNEVVEFDPNTGEVYNDLLFTSMPEYTWAGLEVDATGKVWIVSMDHMKAYALNTPITGGPGVYVYPTGFELEPGECATFYIHNGTFTTPGTYNFNLTIAYEWMYPYTYPVTFTVCPRVYQYWNLMTFPVNATPNMVYAQLADDIVPFSNDATNSNIFAWHAGDGRLVVPTAFERGRGYWVKVWWDETYLDVAGTPYMSSFSMNLPWYPTSTRPGWHLVGNPINERLDWNDVVANPAYTGLYPRYYVPTTLGYAFYEPGFPGGAPRYIIPWKGFWLQNIPGQNGVYAVSRSAIEWSLAKSSEVPEVKTSVSTLPDFLLRLSVSAGTGSDYWNYFGAKVGAADIFENKDVAVPPVEGSGINDFAKFVLSGRNLMADIRAPFESGNSKTYSFRIEGLTNGTPVTVSWPLDHTPDRTDASMGIAQIYPGYTFDLFDQVTNTHVDMRTTGQYSFIYNGPRTLIITVNSTFLGTDGSTKPGQIWVSNHPNPFNAATQITVALPNASDVRLDIIDVSGRLVRRLADGDFSAGVHRFVWDGTDSDGRTISSGVYFYKLTAGESTFSGRMVMVK